jgi:hypothetical protein
MSDLWPDDFDIQASEVWSPLSILQEQASLLGGKTKNIVRAKVTQVPQDFKAAAEDNVRRSVLESMGRDDSTTPFRYAFFLHSPALGGYQYRLFEVSYGIRFYPIRFKLDEEISQELGVDPDKGITADDESAFVEILSGILRSKKTRQVIQAILSQALDAEESRSKRSK